MKSRNTSKKKYRKLRLWPSILLMIVYICACITVVFLFMSLFLFYVGGTKMSRLKNQVDFYGERLNDLLESNQNTDLFMDQLFVEEDTVVLVDDYGKIKYQKGSSLPVLTSDRVIPILGDHEVYKDSRYSLRGGFRFPIRQILIDALFLNIDKENYDNWRSDVIYSTALWMKGAEQVQGDYTLYVRSAFEVKRHEVLWVFYIGLIAFIFFGVTFIILLISVMNSYFAQRRASYLLFYDAVTGGKNWHYFQVRTERELHSFRNTRKNFAIVDLKLDRFREFCLCYGMEKGEALLTAVYRYLSAKTVRHEAVASYAKANFCLLLICDSEEACTRRLRTLMADLSGILPKIHLSFSSGVYMIPAVERNRSGWKTRKQIDNIEHLFNLAGEANEMLGVNKSGQIAYFNEKLLEAQLWTREVEDSLETALKNNDFEIYLQPKYSAVERKLVAAEALIRWKHNGEMVPPAKFIPILEANGSIIRVDDYMISMLAKQMVRWKLEGKKQIPISVNLSRVHFVQENLAEHICALVDAYGADHKYIEIEITESAFFDNELNLTRVIEKLHEFGFGVSMDDFGTGYSSLNSLKNLPLDILKIDMDFFRGQDNMERGEIVVEEIIHLAKRLHMKIVAEGIEREEQVQFLAEKGCDLIQGYFFGAPMPISEFEKKLKEDG